MGVENDLLVKGWMGRARVGSAVVLALAVAVGSPAQGAPHGAVEISPGISVVSEGASERWVVDLGGTLVAALSPEKPGSDSGLLLLVRPGRQADGPRRLLRLRLVPEPKLEVLASDLGGWIESLAAVEAGPSGELELIAGGEERLASLGLVSALPFQETHSERPLLAESGLDLEALSPGPLRRGVERRFVALEPGRLRLWKSAGTSAAGESGESAGTSRGVSLVPEREAALPFSVVRTASGLRLTSPPVTAVRTPSGELLLAGPEAVGATRLRCYRIDPAASGAAPEELWAALPGPEKVQQSWAFEIDGRPVLVVRTQAADELNLFERQRLRVLPLVADRTRAGAAATLAVELDSKRWHETQIALGDVDGDGRDDLLAAFPEGLSGSDLVLQWWRGEGQGRFESRAHRSDLKKAPPGWELAATPQPALLSVGNGRIELRPFTASGKSAVADRPTLAVSIPALPAPAPADGSQGGKRVIVSVGSDGESSKVTNVEPDAQPLGAVELDGRPGAELLAVQASGNGGERLLLLRARAD